MNQFAGAPIYFLKTLQIAERFLNNVEIDEDLSLSLENVGQCMLKMGRDIKGQEYLNGFRLIHKRVAATNK